MTDDAIVFDRAAGFYDETRGFPPGEEIPAAATIAHAGNLTPETSILEIGIGTGRIALPLSEHTGHIYGVDLSRLMMQQLKNKPHSERATLAQADIRRLPFASDKFDAVLAVHIFHLIPDPEAALAEVKRVLRPDGQLIHCWNEHDNPLTQLRRSWKNKIERGSSFQRIWRIDPLLQELGWQKSGEEHTYSFQSAKSPQDSIDQFRNRVWSSTWEMSDEALAEAVTAMEAEAKKMYGDLAQPIPFTSTFHVDLYTPPD